MDRPSTLLSVFAIFILAIWVEVIPIFRIAADAKPGQAPSSMTIRTKENPKDGLRYVWISAGTFQMGCSPGDDDCIDEEKPAHRVAISKGFWIGQTEVTVGAYKRFARRTGKPMPSEPEFLGRKLNTAWTNDAMPMVKMNWYNASDFCAWIDGRLPSEAEWEYAARGGDSEARYGSVDEVAWSADNSGYKKVDSARMLVDGTPLDQGLKGNANRMHEVGQKRRNGFGLFDVLGNAWEWVNDWYDDKYYQSGPLTDPQGPPSGEYKVIRGGSWFDPPYDARASYRGASRPDFGGVNHGFRCVWTATGQ